jgi:hypothetical protein
MRTQMLTTMLKKPPVIPKFSSFQPRKTGSTQAESQGEGDARQKQPRDSSHRREKELSPPQKSRASKKSKGKEALRHRQTKPDSQPAESRPTAASHVALSKARLVADAADSLYVSDRRGDSENLRYGSPSRYNVPRYFRAGYGSVLGLPPSTKIDRQLSAEKHIVLTSNPKSDSAKKRPLLKQRSLDATASEVLVPDRASDPSLDLDAEFIPVGKKRKRGHSSPPLRGPSPTHSADDSVHSDEDAASASEESPMPTIDPVKARNGELSKLKTSEPHNLNAWIELIGHQDAMMRLDRPYSAKLSASEKLALADIKVSMYVEAIPNFKGNEQALETLWLGLLEQGERIWSFEELRTKWNQAIQQAPNSLRLRTGRLNFQQSNYNDFRYGQSLPIPVFRP